MDKSYDVLSIREYFPSNQNPSLSTWVYNMSYGIQQAGIRPIVVSPTSIFPSWLKYLIKQNHAWKTPPSSKVDSYKSVDVIRPGFIKLPSKYFFSFNLNNLSNCITHYGKPFDVKLLHAHFGHAGVSALNLKSIKKIPLITSFYGFDLGSDKKRLSPYYRSLSMFGDLFLALSNDMANDLVELGFPSNKIIVHKLGIDLNSFTPLPQSITKNKFVFLTVATFNERKGIHYTIQAFKAFKEQLNTNSCELRIIGDGPYRDKLYEYARGERDIVFVNNFIAANPRDLIKSEMQLCDVFMLNSITLPNADKEGTPIVLMEAQACGKPCISSLHAGIPEVVIDGETGFLCSERSVSQISDAMLTLYTNSEKRRIFGINARKHIAHNYNNADQILLLKKIYNDII